MNHTYCHFNNPNCKVCKRIEAKKAYNLIYAQAKLQKYNTLYNQIKPFIEKYNKALCEIWKTPYNKYGDIQILEKYGLVSDYWQRYTPKSIAWEYDLKQLDKQLK